MRYIRVEDYDIANRRTGGAFDRVGNIDASGSVRGMQKLYGWPRGGQVRCGGTIYNIGPEAVDRLRQFTGLLRGE